MSGGTTSHSSQRGKLPRISSRASTMKPKFVAKTCCSKIPALVDGLGDQLCETDVEGGGCGAMGEGTGGTTSGHRSYKNAKLARHFPRDKSRLAYDLESRSDVFDGRRRVRKSILASQVSIGT